MFDEDEDAMINWLEDEGALTWEGIAEDGERLLGVNAERMKEVFPELYESMTEQLIEKLRFLEQLGYVEVTIENGEESYAITEEGRKLLNKFGFGVE